MHRIFVVDAGESRKEGNTEERVLEPIRNAPGKHPKHNVGRFSRLAAQPLWVGAGVPVKAVYPDCPHASLAEDSPSFTFGLGYCRGGSLRIVVNQ